MTDFVTEFLVLDVPFDVSKVATSATGEEVLLSRDGSIYHGNKHIRDGCTDIRSDLRGINGSDYMYLRENKWFHSVGTTPEIPLQHKAKIRFIFIGYAHSFFITTDEVVLGIGVTSYGFMYPNGGTPENPFIMRGGFQAVNGKIVQMCGGFAHVIALTDRGELVGSGYSHHGELGTGVNTNLTKPEILPLSQNAGTDLEIEMIASGTFHTLWKTKSGQVYVCGRVTEKSLGPSQQGTSDIFSPVLLDLKDVFAIAGNPKLRMSYVFKRDEMLAWGAYGRKIGQIGSIPEERVVSYPTVISPRQVCQCVYVSERESIVFVVGSPPHDPFPFFLELIQREKFYDSHFNYQ